MKYTAEFDSINSADICAAALKKYISSFSDISVYDELKANRNDNSESDLIGYTVINGLNYGINTPQLSGSAIITGNDNRNLHESDFRSHPVLEVTCRKEDAKTVSRIIIGHGGRNIHVSL